MCEIFGICSKKEYCITDYLKEFFNHSDNHPHGWGLAFFHDTKVYIEKEPVQASKSNYLDSMLSHPINAKMAFAHIRYATIGNIEYSNCHPYTMRDDGGRQWTLIHNGTIFDFPPLDRFVKTQSGDTDSERILLYLVEQINKKEQELQRPLEAKERFSLLDSIIVKMSKGNKLNLLLYDGRLMYVHTNLINSLHLLRKDSCVIFSTQPLSQENWEPLPFTRLLAFQDGELVFEGTNHNNEYIESEENLKYLYQIFSSL